MEQALVQNGAALMYYRVGSFIKEKFLYITKWIVVCVCLFPSTVEASPD